MRTIVIGLGNPLLTDDALGIQAAALLRQRLGGNSRVDVVEAYTGGLDLMELMVGYEQAVVVDAVTTGRQPPGSLVELELADLTASRNTTSSHHASLAVALETGRLLGLPLPAIVLFFGIEAGEANAFGEILTSAVNHALPRLIEQVMARLGQEVLP